MVVLICISLIISDIEQLFMCFWPSLCLLWRNVCLDLLPIFLIGLFYLFFFLSYFDIELHELFVCLGDWSLVGCFIHHFSSIQQLFPDGKLHIDHEGEPLGHKETNVDPEFSDHSVDNGKSSNNWHCYSSTLTWRHSVCTFSLNPYQWQPLDMGIVIIILPMRTLRLIEDK